MISRTAEYALRALAWLAGHPGSSHTTPTIAAETKVPPGYLAKVMKDLARARLVRARHGRGGGFCLSRSPNELSLLDVVNAVDPIRRIHECPLGLAAHAKQLCPLHRRLDEAIAQVEEAFRACSLADLVAESASNAAACAFPASASKGNKSHSRPARRPGPHAK